MFIQTSINNEVFFTKIVMDTSLVNDLICHVPKNADAPTSMLMPRYQCDVFAMAMRVPIHTRFVVGETNLNNPRDSHRG